MFTLYPNHQEIAILTSRLYGVPCPNKSEIRTLVGSNFIKIQLAPVSWISPSFPFLRVIHSYVYSLSLSLSLSGLAHTCTVLHQLSLLVSPPAVFRSKPGAGFCPSTPHHLQCNLLNVSPIAGISHVYPLLEAFHNVLAAPR